MQRYRYKGESYALMQIVKMKDPQSGLWLRAALYMNRQGETFVREWQDFARKFERIE